MVEYYDYEGDKLCKRDKEGKVLLYTAPTKEERKLLTDVYEMDEHDIDSALDRDELGRLDVEANHLVFIMKKPLNYTSEDQLLFKVTSVGMFLFSDKLILVGPDDFDIFEGRQIHKIKNERDLLLKIVYGIIRHFLEHLRLINMLSESLEKRITTSMENRYLLDMFTLEKSLVYFVNGIGSNQMVIEKMRLHASKIGFDSIQLDILDDIVIENSQCSKQADIYSNILTGLMDARGSIVNNNLNTLMKRLTIISVVFMPLNVLAGMGGMSEFSAFTAGALPWWLAYSLFSVALIVIGFTTYKIVNRLGRERKRGSGPRRRQAI